MSGTELYFRLLRHVRPYWRTFGIGVLAIVIVAATEPALPALLKPLLDGVFVNKDESVIRWTPVFIVGLFVLRGLAEYVAQFALNWVGNRLVMDLRGIMFRKLLTLPARYYDDQASGNLISRLTFDVMQVTTAATSVLTAVFKDALVIVGLLGWMFWLNWKLTLLSLVMTPVIVLVVRVISVRLRNSSRQVQQQMGDMTQVIQETIEGHRVVKLFGGQDYEQQRFDAQANNVRRQLMKQVAASAASVPIVQFVAALALATIVYLATQQSNTDQITVGGFVSFITAMLMLTAPLKRVTSVNEPLQRGLAAAESVFALVDQHSETDAGSIDPGRVRGEIRFEQLRFAYGADGRHALDGIDLTIAPGETLALVGASGSGKTTLATLVPRFYQATGGRILIDGHPIETLTLESLRANIALVSQDVVLFNDTVRANIAYGWSADASEQDIIAAAKAANAWDFICQMEKGLDTEVGEDGVKLSGGQRQRLAIARAFLKDAPILILDEATSALDSESERQIQAALDPLMQGRTTLVIAHRLSTIEKADLIVVMEQGRIVERGTHRELLDRDGNYARLHGLQYETQVVASAA